MIEITGLKLSYMADTHALKEKIAKICRTDISKIQSVRILKRALDARKKEDIFYLYSCCVELDEQEERRVLKRNVEGISIYREALYSVPKPGNEEIKGRIVVAGMGPAGLFAGYILAKNGYRPLIIERGKKMEERVRDVETFWNGCGFSENSNAVFGEGGAGTFSDGKLTSRSKDPVGNTVLRIFCEHGAPEEIMYLAKPHIGTDRLRIIIRNLRDDILSMGGEIRFETKLEKIICRNERIEKVLLRSKAGTETMECAALILAIGQGARDTYRMLMDSGFVLQAKPFAIGVRAEHPQKLINAAQFGLAGADPLLGAAEYRLTARSGNRGVYTFCMCPGGKVVAAASEEKQVVVNGMSNYLRNEENANAAVVVQVGPEDFGNEPFSGIDFCRKIEEAAYMAGGGDYFAPAQRVEDFLKRRTSDHFGDVRPSYRPGVTACDLWSILPDFVSVGIADGILSFSRQLKGFDLPDAVLTAPETRTSSPVRILRNPDMQAVNTECVYPAGEGAGYAGGIVSAAIDGIHAAEKVISRFRREDG